MFKLNTDLLTDIEYDVWNILKTRIGAKNAITSKEIRKQLGRGYNRHAICKIIQSLRLNHNIPVGSLKYGSKKGYFLPKNKEELMPTIQDFTIQADKLLQQIDVLNGWNK